MFRSTRTGTVFVTASNSDERSRTETDFLCDGTADDAEIQAAVDSLPSGGGMVVLSEGTFTLATTISRSITNITIMGMGMGTRLVNNASTKLISDGAQAGWAFLEFDTDAGDITASGTGVVSNYWLNGARQVPAGTGNVVGDTASVDKELVRFNSTTGKIIESPNTDNSALTATLSNTGNLTIYNSDNDTNPRILIGATATERFAILPVKKAGTALINYVDIFTDTANSDADAGELRFAVDGALQLTIDDGGLEIRASGSLSFGAIDILSDSAGTTTLSNIDAIDTTTGAAIEADVDHDLLVSFETDEHFTQAAIVATGAVNAGSITSGFTSIDVGSGAILTTGVVTAGTFDATGTASQADKATLGSSTNFGAIITGQGSTGDIALTNDLLEVALYIPTGTKNVKIANSLYVTEQAAADGDTAGDGQFWVRSNAPNTPMFTGDSGLDYELNILRKQITTLDNDEVLALRATPKNMIGSPAGNRTILIDRIFIVANDTAGAWTESSDNLIIEYQDGTDISESITASALVGGGTQFDDVRLGSDVTPDVDAAVRLFNTGSNEWGGGNVANSMVITLWFYIVDTVII